LDIIKSIHHNHNSESIIKDNKVNDDNSFNASQISSERFLKNQISKINFDLKDKNAQSKREDSIINIDENPNEKLTRTAFHKKSSELIGSDKEVKII
jgi:hypothetical protein